VSNISTLFQLVMMMCLCGSEYLSCLLILATGCHQDIDIWEMKALWEMIGCYYWSYCDPNKESPICQALMVLQSLHDIYSKRLVINFKINYISNPKYLFLSSKNLIKRQIFDLKTNYMIITHVKIFNYLKYWEKHYRLIQWFGIKLNLRIMIHHLICCLEMY
jgi:hypothetical protein